MFRYSLFLDTLFKALTHKYIRRVPKGVTKTGKTKYMYYYAGQEGHGRGIAHEEELVTGASFAFGEHGKTRYHAHITKVDGDKLTIKYDDGDKKGTEETMTKKQFQALVHGEHATGIKEAQAKSEKQLKDFQAGKEKGVKVKQSTLDRLAQRVANLKDLVSHMDKPAPIEAPWMSERERRLFEGQNRLFQLLENKKITRQLLIYTEFPEIVTDMLRNVSTAIFKYKDTSQLSKNDKDILVSLSTRAINPSGKRYENLIWESVLSLSDLWQKLPFSQEIKSVKIGRLDIIQPDLFNQTVEQSSRKALQIEAVNQAQKELMNVNTELSKIIYGNIIFTQLHKMGTTAGGMFGAGFPVQKIEHAYFDLETVYHSADVIYLNTDLGYDLFKTPIKNNVSSDMLNKIRTDEYKCSLIHELAHRFSNSLLEKDRKTKMAFSKDLENFAKKFAHRKRDFTKLHNIPIKQIATPHMFNTPLMMAILTAPIFNEETKEITGKQVTKDVQDNQALQKVSISTIDFSNLGNTYISNFTDTQTSLHIPLVGGGKFSISLPMPPSKFYALFNDKENYYPSSYANESRSEMFSEMMVAVCDPNYKDEPIRTELLALVNKYMGDFGA